MGIYLNPGNGKFKQALNSEIFVDKTGLISYTNSVMFSEQKSVCVSRPRRFGKSMAANMLAAYYGRMADSAALFAGFEIANDPCYETHLGKYDVVFLNMADFLSRSKDMRGMIELIQDELIFELEEEYGDRIGVRRDITAVLHRLCQKEGAAFVILIDEWDCVFRVHSADKEAQKLYLDFLRLFLKDKDYVALAYMTGILPVKKYGTHSALNMFREFSMADPKQLSRFAGFTQEEVDALCARYGMNADEAAAWYNGYRFVDVPAAYNPQSVVESMLNRRYGSYWTKTESYEALKVYIDMNHDGLRDAVMKLLAGGREEVNVDGFANDMVTFSSYRDVLTLLVHLGYLGYDSETKEVFIPNKEIAVEYVLAMEAGGWDEVAYSVRASKRLLDALWALDADAVAAGVEKAHLETSHLTYNDENALAYTISLALYAAREYYRTFRELPTGKGFADLVLVPRPFHPEKPAAVIELKWDKAADAAIDQIKRRDYPEALKDYRGNLLLAGISYDRATRKHSCVIERHAVI
jgi:hypothetical protein